MEQELKNLKGEKMRMYEEYAAGTLSLDNYKNKKQEYDRKIAEVQDKIEQSKVEEAAQSVVPGTVRAAAEQAENFLHGTRLTASIVSDYEKSKDFYVNKLGFAIVRENFRKERNDWKLDLRVGEGADAIELEIFAEPNPPKRVNRPEACGLRHLAFRVDDVEATVAELEQMGIGCEPIRLDSYTQKKMTFFFDPDGLPLELHE